MVRGRDEGGGGGSGGGSGEGINDLLLVLPHGRSVADVLDKVGHVPVGYSIDCRLLVCRPGWLWYVHLAA